MAIVFYHGDSLDVLKRIPDNSIDSVVTDPPYGLSDHKPDETAACLSAWLAGDTYRPKKGGFMGKCYHPDTEVLTKDGWRLMRDVSVGTPVASLNPETKHLEFVPVILTHTYPFEGNLLHFDHRSAEQIVTSNHKVYVGNQKKVFGLREARKVQKFFHMSNQAEPFRGKNDPIVVGKHVFDPADFFYMLGLFLGDGYCVTRSLPRCDNWFGFSVKKKRKVASITKSFEALNVNVNIRSSSDRTIFECWDRDLYSFFVSLGKATAKHIPNWIFEYDASSLRRLYDGLMDTDGCIQGEQQNVYSTSSKQLADDFQTLCLLIGKSCICTVRAAGDMQFPHGTSFCNEGYILPVLEPGKTLYCQREKRQFNVKRVAHSGDVVCLTLERNHIMYVRYNGKPVWSGNSWDAWVPGPEIWKECLRVLKPGGHMLVFAGTRSMDLMSMAVRLSGFELRDSIGYAHDGGGAPLLAYVYGSGFPKNMDISKAIDKKAGVEREVIGIKPGHENFAHRANHPLNGGWDRPWASDPEAVKRYHDQTAAGSDEAKTWEGWGTALKPAWEPIILARKPVEGTIADNVLKHGVGGINVDACRVEPTGESRERIGEKSQDRRYTEEGSTNFAAKPGIRGGDPAGRFPANLIHDGSDEVVLHFPDSAGQQGDVKGTEKSHTGDENTNCYGEYGRVPFAKRSDTGSAARFFYSAKATKADRAGSKHPTVKPVALISYLVRLVTPVGGTVLDPFAGSGTTGQAALDEGFKAVLIEREAEYAEDIRNRFVMFIDEK
jgi:DNA modification methylase